MNTYSFRLVAIVCFVICSNVHLLIAQKLAFGQTYVVSFDKLTKTTLDFTAKSKPSFSVEPKLAAELVTVRFDNTMKAVVVEKPLPSGTYTFTLKQGKSSTKATLTVLPSTLDTTSTKHQGIVPLQYGKRLAIRTKLPDGASILPLKDFSISYQIGNEREIVDNPYSESYIGPNIPASARLVSASVSWKYPLTGERVVLWSQKVSVTQAPPELVADAQKIEINLDTTKRELALTVRRIRINADVPFDADNKDPNASRSIKASLGEVEVDLSKVTLDLIAQETSLEVIGKEATSWKPTNETLKLTESKYDEKTGEFVFHLSATGLPQGTKALRGTVKMSGIVGKIINRKAGVAGVQNFSAVVRLQ